MNSEDLASELHRKKVKYEISKENLEYILNNTQELFRNPIRSWQMQEIANKRVLQSPGKTRRALGHYNFFIPFAGVTLPTHLSKVVLGDYFLELLNISNEKKINGIPIPLNGVDPASFFSVFLPYIFAGTGFGLWVWATKGKRGFWNYFSDALFWTSAASLTRPLEELLLYNLTKTGLPFVPMGGTQWDLTARPAHAMQWGLSYTDYILNLCAPVAILFTIAFASRYFIKQREKKQDELFSRVYSKLEHSKRAELFEKYPNNYELNAAYEKHWFLELNPKYVERERDGRKYYGLREFTKDYARKSLAAEVNLSKELRAYKKWLMKEL